MRWRDDGRIVDFKVLLRPLKAVNLMHQKMAAMLQIGDRAELGLARSTIACAAWAWRCHRRCRRRQGVRLPFATVRVLGTRALISGHGPQQADGRSPSRWASWAAS